MTAAPPPPARPAPPRAKKPTRVHAMAWAVLVIGLAASVLVSVRWAASVSTNDRDDFEAQAESVRAVVSSELRVDESLVASLQGYVGARPDLTNTEFLRWYHAAGTAERFPGGVDLGYIERVPAATLAEFGAEVSADPISGLPARDTYTVFPDTIESEYCLQRVGIWTRTEVRGFEIPSGLNMCAVELPGIGDSEVPELLSAATDTGDAQVLAPEQFVDGSFVVLAPVYSNGPTSTAEGRRASSVGWVTGSFDAASLTRFALEGTTDLSLTVTHTDATGETFTIAGSDQAAEGRAISLPVHDNAGWSVTVRGPEAAGGISPFLEGLVVLIAGAALSALAFMLVRALTGARSLAVETATERTTEIDYQSLHDELTGLPTRTLLLDRVTQMQARAQRSSGVVAALSVEIDSHASISDTLGHDAADTLVQAAAARITSALRDTDTVGRITDNGFVVLVQGDLPLATPQLAAQRIIDVLAEPFSIDATTVPIETSIGIAVGASVEPSELLRNADVAMYRAKEVGDASYTVFEPAMGVDMDRRVEIERDLRRALERDQLFIQYQPTFDLRTGTITGAEALVRWQHPTRGLIPPSDFIPFAERSGRIVPIGRWVLREACVSAAQWTRDGHAVRVAVNMSTVQIEDDTFVNDVKDALAAAALPPHQLVLELTETALLSDTSVVRFRLEALKDLGVGIAIDDFGTGYTSLTYLQQFPVDMIKIDKCFIDEIATSSDAAALSRTLMQLGRSLGLETLAEGIETREQLAELVREGCHAGQGFLYSRPVDAATIGDLLRRPPPAHHTSWTTEIPTEAAPNIRRLPVR